MFRDLPRDALMRPLTRNEVVGMLLRLTIFGAATYYSIKWVVEAMDPTTKQKNQAKKRVGGALSVSIRILQLLWPSCAVRKGIANIKTQLYHLPPFFCLGVQAEHLMKRIGVEGVKLTEYEMNIASHLVDPQTMNVGV